MQLNCQFKILRRYKVMYIYSILVYVMLAFYDTSSGFNVKDISAYISRCNMQQVVIVFSIGIIVSLLVNENSMRLFEDMLNIYVESKKKYFNSILVVLAGSNILLFTVGQIFSYLNTKSIPFSLFIVNLCIVSLECIIAIQIFMTIRLWLRKTILTYIVYLGVIFLSLMLNNVFISLPLNINILETEGYYYTYGWQLWIGRVVLFLVSNAFYQIVLQSVIKSD